MLQLTCVWTSCMALFCWCTYDLCLLFPMPPIADNRPTLTTMLPFTPNPTPTTSPTVTSPSVSPPLSYSGSSILDTNSESSPRKSVDPTRDLTQDARPYHHSEYTNILDMGSVGERTPMGDESGKFSGEDSNVNGESCQENEKRTQNGDEEEVDGNEGSVWLWGPSWKPSRAGLKSSH